jgi:hypothetical protein
MHKPTPKHEQKGHREKFEDGTYICAGTFGHIRNVAEHTAAEMAKRYRYKVRLTEKSVRVQGENGTVRKPLYLIWVKAI